MTNLNDLFAEEEAKRLAEANTPEAIAEWNAQLERIAARRKAEHEKGVRLGWHDEEGNSLLPPEEDEEGEDEA